ncbi:gluconate 2-dehydrogenase subunit 3 family protein [Hymenobacter sp. BT188]|uniref:gluconate 2-dehydrogenase subunit 3 family protein n=1 Tax=Hymenobacter sp. BT188 TaxID=2763504 RepID=UPI001651185D|nr:gluconate 2-dehydrogenase subunit 3 family protein [Hymenobacter sp. BT188]MBC6608679.1 gluconate 2-dehydrogenase subunit 3 family protein [Hymenobacter sp. BT188]
MTSPHYPDGTVRALLDTELVTEATRTALQARLDAPPYEPQFLEPATYDLLRAVAACLFPQPDRPDAPIELAPGVDQRLAEGRSDGWRYDIMPPDREAYRMGLGGINQTSHALFQQEFRALTPDEQASVLQLLQEGKAPGEAWETVPSDRFFEEMLAELTELYYAHPLAQEEIGYVGMADATGWNRLGLNDLEPREPEAISPQPGL